LRDLIEVAASGASITRESRRGDVSRHVREAAVVVGELESGLDQYIKGTD